MLRGLRLDFAVCLPPSLRERLAQPFRLLAMLFPSFGTRLSVVSVIDDDDWDVDLKGICLERIPLKGGGEGHYGDPTGRTPPKNASVCPSSKPSAANVIGSLRTNEPLFSYAI